MNLMILLSVFCFSQLVFGSDTYKWTDENGQIHYADKKPKNSSFERRSTPNGSPSSELSARSEESVRKKIEESKGKIYALYSKELKNNPSIRGKFVTKYVIAASGKIIQFSIVHSDLNSNALERAIIQEIEKIDFGQGAFKPITIHYSFDFAPSLNARKK
jgi:Domain of unknown function (DUF4124)